MMNHIHTIYNSEAEAQAVADANRHESDELDGDDAWAYTVKVDEKSGRAVIEIADEDGNVLGLL